MGGGPGRRGERAKVLIFRLARSAGAEGIDVVALLDRREIVVAELLRGFGGSADEDEGHDEREEEEAAADHEGDSGSAGDFRFDLDHGEALEQRRAGMGRGN